MKKLLIILLVILCGCSSKEEEPLNEVINDDLPYEEVEKEEEKMRIEIDGNYLEVNWEDNESVKELTEMVSKQVLTINMHRYGGFEQVGSLGFSLTSDDTRLTSKPGDIYLYDDNQIVIFFGSNTWSYTKLGSIINIDDLNTLLDKESVELKISLEG